MKIFIAAVVALAISSTACGTADPIVPAEPAPTTRTQAPTTRTQAPTSRTQAPTSAILEPSTAAPISEPETPTADTSPEAPEPEPEETPTAESIQPAAKEPSDSDVSGPQEAALATLDDAGFIDENGLVRLDPNLPTDDGILDALCTAAFGPTRELAKRLKLPRQLKQRDGGLMTSDAGNFLLCPYYVNDSLHVIVEVGRSNNTWDGGHSFTADSGDIHATISYNPDHTGKRVGKRAARDYLGTVLDAVAP